MIRSMALLIALSLFGAGSALAQQPGAPVAPGCIQNLTLAEPIAESGQESVAFGFPPGCQVFAGAVVLVENPARDPRDPHNWSDVAVFFTPGALPVPGSPATLVVFVSDPAETGISDADLAAAGVPVPTSFLVSGAATLFIPENPLGPDNPYQATGPGGQIAYIFVSDPPEQPTPAGRASWGHVKDIYR